MKDEDNQWTLESPMITSKTGSLSISTVISTDIWQRNAKQRRKNERPGHASNVIRKDILQKIAKGSRQ